MYSLLGSIALLAAFASTASAHGYVTSIVADGVTYEGWQILYWYNIDNGMDYPDVIGWYAENLDIGFVPPHQYAYVPVELIELHPHGSLNLIAAATLISSATRMQCMPTYPALSPPEAPLSSSGPNGPMALGQS